MLGRIRDAFGLWRLRRLHRQVRRHPPHSPGRKAAVLAYFRAVDEFVGGKS